MQAIWHTHIVPYLNIDDRIKLKIIRRLPLSDFSEILKHVASKKVFTVHFDAISNHAWSYSVNSRCFGQSIRLKTNPDKIMYIKKYKTMTIIQTLTTTDPFIILPVFAVMIRT